jgi:hypothetical protein
VKTLFKYMAATFLFCAAISANAQTLGFTTFQGKLSFPREMVNACPLLQRSDSANVYLYANATKTTANLGVFGFITDTPSGVLVYGEGTLIANTSSGTFYVTALTIGDPLGANCSFVNLNMPVAVRAPNHRPFRGEGF